MNNKPVPFFWDLSSWKNPGLAPCPGKNEYYIKFCNKIHEITQFTNYSFIH